VLFSRYLIVISVPGSLALAILMLATYAPIIHALFGFPIGEYGYQLLFNICHQYPLRSFWLLDHPMAICARCTDGYLGIVAASVGLLAGGDVLLVAYLNRPGFAAFLFTMGVGDAVFKVLTGIDSTNYWRLMTGFFGGFGFMVLLTYTATTIGNLCGQVLCKTGGHDEVL